MKGRMTQGERILWHLKQYGSITPREALEQYGIMRLGARIWDLKHDGHLILSVREDGYNKFGEPTHYSRYLLRQ